MIDLTLDRHGSAILEIFNDAIANTTALYEYKPRTMDTMRTWFATKSQNAFPVIGVEGETGTLLGFASYGTFRAFPAFKYTVEHSVYVHKDARGRGVGELLLKAIIARAQANAVHVMVGGIDSVNVASLKLHEKAGFTHCGTVAQAGFKFGRWLDLVFYQMILQTPSQPVDG